MPLVLGLLGLGCCATNEAATAAPPFIIRVLPTGVAGADLCGDPTDAAGCATVGSLATSAASVADVLASGSRDVVVELQPGRHAVPPGGLLLGPEHSPASPAHAVRWQAVPGAAPGNTSVHGGVAVTGWKPSSDKALPPGVMAAPMPPQLVGKRARHLYVGGTRANRTREPSGIAFRICHS